MTALYLQPILKISTEHCLECKRSLRPNETFWDGNWTYCLGCIESRVIDSTGIEQPVNWSYCELCRDVIDKNDYLGPCEIQAQCFGCRPYLSDDEGFRHLCKECGMVWTVKNTEPPITLISCVMCASNRPNNVVIKKSEKKSV